MAKPLFLMTSIIGIVLTIILLFNIVSGSSSNMIEASESVTQANNCSDFTGQNGEALVFNVTDGGCYMTNTSFQSTADQYDLPLEGLFASNGVLWLIFMAVFLLLLVGIVIIKVKTR